MMTLNMRTLIRLIRMSLIIPFEMLMKCNQKKVKETVFITAAHIRRAIIPIAI